MERIGPDAVPAWIAQRASGAARYLFGVTGPPGCGKSTFAARVGARLGAPVVPMDGFHRTGAELAARGQLGIKGAPETFDADAFVDLVRRLRRGTDTVECPVFDRTIDEPVAGGVIVRPDDPVVIIEGNYLLLDRAPWAELRDLLDDVAHLETPTADRIRRLVDRHVEFGRDRSDAVQFVHRSDEANTRLIERCRARADLLVSFPPPSAP